jgi:MFS family permease
MSFPLVLAGLLVHGFCYCFVFVAAFIYVGRKAPPEISASAQSLVALLMWGIGALVGTQLAGLAGEVYGPTVSIAATKGEAHLPKQPLPDWASVEGEFNLPNVLGDHSREAINLAAVEELAPPTVKVGEMSYAKEDLVDAMKQVDVDRSGTVTRLAWQSACAHRWVPIWLWPGALAAGVCLLFLLGGRDVPQTGARPK